MPGGFEDYVQDFNEAAAAWRKWRTVLTDMGKKIARLAQNPGDLDRPDPTWLSRDDLAKIYQEAMSKLASLQAKYDALPRDVRTYAPSPDMALQM